MLLEHISLEALQLGKMERKANFYGFEEPAETNYFPPKIVEKQRLL